MASFRLIACLHGLFAHSMSLACLCAQSENELLLEAQAWQLRGKPEQSIRILEPILPHCRDASTRWKMQRQYAIALSTSGADSLARVHVHRLLKMNPSYEMDALNDPPAFANVLQLFKPEAATSLHLHAGFGMSGARAYRIYRPAAYDKSYSAVPAYTLAAGISHHFNKKISFESGLQYARGGFDYAFTLSDWTEISVKERTDLLALPLALRIGVTELRRNALFLRAGLSPALALNVRSDYFRTLNGADPVFTALTGSRSSARRNTFQLALHSGFGWQQSTQQGRFGVQLAANYWLTPWIREAARFDAPDISYAYFLYDDDLRRTDISIQIFAERNIHWRIRQHAPGIGTSKPWQIWLQAPSELAGNAAEAQLKKAQDWLARSEFRRITDSVPAWVSHGSEQAARLLRLEMLAFHALGDSLRTAAAINKLLALAPQYLNFPGSDPLPLQQQLSQYRILHRLEIGIQAAFFVPTMQLLAYHSIAGAHPEFRSTPGYTTGFIVGREIHPALRFQSGLQLIGFGYTARSENLNDWQQHYREWLQYVAMPLRLLWQVPERPYGISLGGQAAQLTQARSEVVIRNTSGGISRNTFNNYPDRLPMQWCWTAGIFCRVPAGDGFLQAEGQWMQFSNQFNRPEKRFTQPGYRLDYGVIDSDLRFGGWQLSCAYILPLSYQPKHYSAR